MDNPILDPRHLDIMEEMLNITVDMARKRRQAMGDNVPSDENVEVMLKISKGVQENIKTVTALKLKQEENDITRESNDKLTSEVLIAWHAQEAERNKAAMRKRRGDDGDVIEHGSYEKQGLELTTGEVITGKDGITYAQFKEENDI